MRLLPTLIAGAALLAASPIPAPAAPGVPSDRAADARAFFDHMDDYFDRHPELKERRGSGWNPYNRIKWLESPIFADGAPPTAEHRWALLEEAQRRAARHRSASAWFELGPVNLSGRILDVEFDPADPSIVYVGAASGGLWKSVDGGDTWAPITDLLPSLGIGGVQVSPLDSDVVLIGTGEGTPNFGRVGGVGVLKSTDAGATWNPTGLSFAVSSGSGFHFLEANPVTAVYLGGTDDGLYRSTDEGNTWTEVGGGGDWWDAVWEPGTSRVYTFGGGSSFGGGAGNRIRVSTDDGLTWTSLTSGLPSPFNIGKSKLAIAASSPSTVFAHITSAGSYSTLGIYRSTDSGATWQLRGNHDIAGGQGWYNASIAVDPDDPNVVIAGGIELWRSVNAGATFTEVGDGYGLGTDTAVHWDHHAILYEPGSSSALWVGTDGGVWRSTDDGVNWISRREGMGTYQFYDVCVSQTDPDWLMGGAQDNGVPGPVAAQDWFTSNLFADGMVCNVHPTDPTIIYAEWQGGQQVKSTDSGGDWFDIQGAMGGGPWVTAAAIDRSDGNRLFAGCDNRIYRTTNGGSSWQNMASFSAIWIDVNPVDGNQVWAVGSSGVRRSSNGGTTWGAASSYGFSVGTPTKIAADPGVVGGALVTFASYNAGPAKIARTTDYGASWTNVTGDFPAEPVNCAVIDPQFPDDWYIGTDTGVWLSTDGGAHWNPYDVNLPHAVIWDLEIRDSPRKLVAGTYGRGAWETSIRSAGTDAPSVAVDPETSRRLMLDAPSPNPVRDGTRLRFAARHDGPVTLSVYDVAGRLVTPVTELSRGDGLVRSVAWSAADAPAGVYFAVLEAGERRVSRRMVVVK